MRFDDLRAEEPWPFGARRVSRRVMAGRGGRAVPVEIPNAPPSLPVTLRDPDVTDRVGGRTTK
jgi:hypothetical protein